jgi:hypothetical protein
MVEEESAAALASAHGEDTGFTQRVAVLEGELMVAHQARDTTEVSFRDLSRVATNADWWWEEAERECQQRVQELMLLQTRGSEP